MVRPRPFCEFKFYLGSPVAIIRPEWSIRDWAAYLAKGLRVRVYRTMLRVVAYNGGEQVKQHMLGPHLNRD